jgi:hypothetical protein
MKWQRNLACWVTEQSRTPPIATGQRDDPTPLVHREAKWPDTLFGHDTYGPAAVDRVMATAEVSLTAGETALAAVLPAWAEDPFGLL